MAANAGSANATVAAMRPVDNGRFSDAGPNLKKSYRP